jgi:hypothetical protein
VATIDFPDDLIELERSAWEQIQAGALTVDTARAVQDGVGRYDVEMGLKRAVRHPAAEAA